MTFPRLPRYARPELARELLDRSAGAAPLVLYAPPGSGKSWVVEDLGVAAQEGAGPCLTIRAGPPADPGVAVRAGLEAALLERALPLPSPVDAVPAWVGEAVSTLASGGGLTVLVDDGAVLLEGARRTSGIGAALVDAVGGLGAGGRLILIASSWVPRAWPGTSTLLPVLGTGFVHHRAELFEAMTGRALDVDGLVDVFGRLRRMPSALDAVLMHMVVGRLSDPGAGLAAWLAAAGASRLGPAWLSLSPLERVVVEHLSLGELGRAERASLFGEAFVSLAAGQRDVEGPVTASRVQTHVKRLMRRGVVWPTGDQGGYAVGDRGLALYVEQLHRTGHCTCNRQHSGSLWD